MYERQDTHTHRCHYIAKVHFRRDIFYYFVEFYFCSPKSLLIMLITKSSHNWDLKKHFPPSLRLSWLYFYSTLCVNDGCYDWLFTLHVKWVATPPASWNDWNYDLHEKTADPKASGVMKIYNLWLYPSLKKKNLVEQEVREKQPTHIQYKVHLNHFNTIKKQPPTCAELESKPRMAI